MKKATLLVLMTFICLSGAFAGKFIQKYNFQYPSLLTSGIYTEIQYPNCWNTGMEGTPNMPYYNVNVLIPQGEHIVAVNILEQVFYGEKATITIIPAAKPFPISQPATNYKLTQNAAIYQSTNQYPNSILSESNTGYLSGHGIGSFTICPVSWIPAEKSAQFLQYIAIEIVTEKNNKSMEAQQLLRTSKLIEQRITNLVDNSELLDTYTYNNTRFDDETDLLVITSEALLPAFEDFVNFKNSTGYLTHTITIETIYANYEGADNQEKIRNCIIDYYTNHNLQYVILGGDSDPANSNDYIIPHRGFFAQDELDIPSDLYYCCLDGTWNDDGDNMWGEAGETDLFSEVLIGRFCVDNDEEIANLTHKNILYQTEPVLEDIENTLMLGEQLDDEPTYGGNYKDEIADGSSSNGYTTAAINDNFTIVRVYDRDMNWNKNTIFNKFNITGLNLMNHLGHSNTTYNMKMTCDDVTTVNFTNDGVTRGYVVGYSQGCYNGSFDNRSTDAGSYGSQDSFAEYITNLETADVACVSNSRYGWYMPGSTNSSSQMYDREFFDALFGEGISMIGAMNADSKEDNPGIFNSNDNYRWVAYETNLFGDPTLDVWTAQPQDITATIPPSIIIGSSHLIFDITIPAARIAIMQNGELIGRGLTDQNGFADVEFFDLITSTEPITASIIAHNYNRLTQEMIVISDQPYVVFNQCNINDNTGNGNGELDYNESILLDMTLINVGDQPSSAVTANLSTEDEYITITQGTHDYGSFDAGQEISIEDAFAFDIADNIPDGHVISFSVEALGNETWNSTFKLSVNAPKLAIISASINDDQGNGNGYADPGEILDYTINIENFGHADINSIIMNVVCESEYITINSGAATTIDALEAGTTEQVTLNISIDENTPEGTLANFSFIVKAGAYSISDESAFKIGLILENFETGDFSANNWVFGGNADWTIVDSPIYEGTYAARSGVISNNQLSFMQIENYDVDGNDSIAFMVKVSTEATYDYLYFYLGDEQVGEWEGEKDWQRVAFAVPEGINTFRWLYKKDQYETGGQDCAWVDFIELPAPDLGVGITETYNDNSLAAMPNPAVNNLTVRLDNPKNQQVTLYLTSIDGKSSSMIIDGKDVAKGVHTFNVQLSDLPNGIYILSMQNEDITITKKVIISK